jgi:hypothetical protein
MQNTIKLILDTEDVLDAFSLQRHVGCALLDEWLSYQTELDASDQKLLEKKRRLLQDEGEYWNEEELKMNFLALLFEIVDMNVPDKIKLFYERPLSAIIDNYEINVVCDAMLASPKGVGKPKKPYFFLQEFKKQKGKSQDAEGQMLAAMLVAQLENANHVPVYGCYIQGKYWTFSTLHDKNYCVSASLDATNTAHLQKIVFALKNLKNLIIKQIA